MTIKSEKITIIDQMDRCTKAMRIIQNSPAYKTHAIASAKIRQEFKKVEAERSISKMIEIEKVALEYSCINDANSTEEVNSLTHAIKEINASQQAFSQLVANPEVYKQSVQVFSPKDIKDKLPLDASRKFFKSHYTRLDNSLKAAVNENEKLLLRQRKINIKTLEKCYTELQEKALGIPSKDKGLSR